METPIDLKLDIKKTFKRLEDLTTHLKRRLVYSDHPHVTFSIPVREVLDAPLSLPVRTNRNEDAWDTAMDVYGKFYREEVQHPSSTIRLPGLVFLDNPESYRELVDEINATKDALKALFLSLDYSKRNSMVSRALPGVVLLQAYRHIELLDKPARRFVFSWISTNASTIVKLTQAKDWLKKDKADAKEPGFVPPGNQSLSEWLAMIEEEIELVEALPQDAPLRRSKPIAPHPRLMVFDKEGSMTPMETYPANLPLLAKWEEIEEGEKPLQIRELKDYKGSRASKIRSDYKPKSIIVPHRHLYLLES